MLDRIITGVTALGAPAPAPALGGSVIVSARPIATHYSAEASLRSDTAEAPSSSADTSSRSGAQSGNQTGGRNTGSSTEATLGSNTPAETPSSEAGAFGGHPDLPGASSNSQAPW